MLAHYHGFAIVAALVASLSSIVIAATQTPAAQTLPAALRAHLNTETFSVVTSIRGLPLGVRDEMQRLFGGTLDIANPDDQTEPPATSIRRLVQAGCSRDHHCLVYYELREGSGNWRVALFHWAPEETRLEWGGIAPGDLKSIEDVRRVAVTGRVKPATSW